jgi:hypothetical protein
MYYFLQGDAIAHGHATDRVGWWAAAAASLAMAHGGVVWRRSIQISEVFRRRVAYS